MIQLLPRLLLKVTW